MSLFAEFHVPSESFALHKTLQSVPEAVIDIERVVATEDILTPYFWAAGADRGTMTGALDRDPSVKDLTTLDEFEETTLFRAEWTENVETIVYAYTDIGAVILEARGHDADWMLRLRFDDRGRLDEFRGYCRDHDIPFQLTRLYELAHPRTGGQYGLTPKQHEALVRAWERGYYDSPRRATLTDVAEELDITQQSLSQRLRRGHHSLIANTLLVVPPAGRE